ncbi:MAG: hypothetical protein HY438_02915 [DPANN group archaeon]|nr:hypothetical protein [DPANN group archaeon]
MLTEEEIYIKGFSMEKAKQKLGQSESQDPLLRGYERLLAQRLNPEVSPAGFLTAALATLNELKRGVDSVTGQPLQRALAEQDPMSLRMLLVTIPRIAGKVVSAEFGDSVERVYFLMMRDMRNRK